MMIRSINILSQISKKCIKMEPYKFLISNYIIKLYSQNSVVLM